MIEKKQQQIIQKLKNTKEVKNINELKIKLKQNIDYNKIMNKKIKTDEELIKARKELYKIKEYNEYVKLCSDIKLLFIQINNIITSIVENKVCKK